MYEEGRTTEHKFANVEFQISQHTATPGSAQYFSLMPHCNESHSGFPSGNQDPVLDST